MQLQKATTSGGPDEVIEDHVKTALHHAAGHDQLTLVRVLVGAVINQQDKVLYIGVIDL